MTEQAKCPWCGLLVVKDDAAQTIAHESPVCARFDEAMRAGVEAPEVREVQPHSLQAHFAALRARVRNKRTIGGR